VLGAYQLIVNNDLIHYTMFLILMIFKSRGYITDHDYYLLISDKNPNSEMHQECFEILDK
jgi:hypothetical protein